MSDTEGSGNNLNENIPQNAGTQGFSTNYETPSSFDAQNKKQEPMGFDNSYQSNEQQPEGVVLPEGENSKETVEDAHTSRLDELLSSYDPNTSINEDKAAFNVDVNEVVEQVASSQPQTFSQPKKPHAQTVTADTSVSLGQTFDKQEDEIVTVQPVKFANFENEQIAVGTPKKNLDIMQDVLIKVTVELGRCRMKLKKVLDIQKGSIIEINKVAGEQVELFVSGKLVAHGEVIVMEDKFGLRITSIVEEKSL